MAFNLSLKVQIVNPVSSIDNLYGPYNSVTEAEETFSSALLGEKAVGRHIGIYLSDGKVIDYIYQKTDDDTYAFEPITAECNPKWETI